MLHFIKKFIKDEEGATMTEYVLLIALIAIAMFAVIKLFGEQIARIFRRGREKLQDAEEVEHFPTTT